MQQILSHLYASELRKKHGPVSPPLCSPPKANTSRKLHGSQEGDEQGPRVSQALPLGSSVESNGRRPKEEKLPGRKHLAALLSQL